MKKALFISACAAFALAACSEKEITPATSQEAESLMKIEVNTDEISGTRAGSPSGDAAISNWNVFVFNGESLVAGRLDIPSSSTSCTLKVKQAENLCVYVVANLGDTSPLANVKSLSDLTSATSRLVKENNSQFTMAGRKTVQAKGATTSANVSLHRLVSRIQVEEIKVDFTENPALAGQAITNLAVYIKNAPTTATLGMKPDGSTFMANGTDKADGSNWSEASNAAISGILGDLACGKIDDGKKLDGGIRYFHCYQNCFSTTPAKGQAVRLVVKGTLLGKDQYWAFDLNTNGYGYKSGDYGVIANTIYKVSLAIKNFGSDNADDDVEYTSLSSTIDVAPWITNDLGTVEY